MNTGLSDAFSLIWRLYFLLKYTHPSEPHLTLPVTSATSILASFDIERRATANHVIDVAAKLVRSTTADAKGYVGLIEKNAGFITGMGVQYSNISSLLVQESEHGVWKAGYRAPDLWLHDNKTQDAVRFYQKMVYGRYVLVLVGEKREVRVRRPGFLMVVRLVGLKSMGMGVEGQVAEQEEQKEFDEEAFGCDIVKEGEAYAVLVRPDCYVEIVGAVDEVFAYFEECLPGLVDVVL